MNDPEARSVIALRFLAHRRSAQAILAIGVLLGLFTLRLGFFTDDFSFLAFLEHGGPLKPSTTGLYDFAGSARWKIDALMARGPFPWWTATDLKLRFWRPLSSALFVLDHAMFGHEPLGYHVHALLLYTLFLAGVASLYRRLFPRPVFAGCLLVFALSAAHCEPLGWLASRHLLVAATPAVWGLVAQIAYRERGFAMGRWLAVALLLVGLTGGEAALGIALYWAGYELVGQATSTRLATKLARAAVPLGIATVYLVGYKLANYGSANNAAYFEPLSDPTTFAMALSERLPVALGEMFFGVPSALSVVMPKAPFVVAGFVAISSVLALLWSVWGSASDDSRRAMRWLATGAIGSLVVSLGGFPGSRLLLVPSVGSAACLGLILCHAWDALDARPLAVVLRRAGWLLLFVVHVVLAPLMFVGGANMLREMGERTEQISASLDPLLPPEDDPAQAPSVFFIASDPEAGIYVGAARAVRAPGTFSGWTALSMAHATHDIRRVDDRTLIIETDRPMLQGPFDGVFRDPSRAPLRAGDRIELDQVAITIQAAENGYPTRIEARFVAPLEDRRFRFLAWQDGRLRALAVPEGARVVIPWSPGPTGFF